MLAVIDAVHHRSPGRLPCWFWSSRLQIEVAAAVMRPSNRPHYGPCPSVCLLVPHRLITRKQKINQQLAWTFPGKKS